MGATADLVEMVSRIVALNGAGARELAASLLAEPEANQAFRARTVAILSLADYLDASYADAVVRSEQAVALAQGSGDSEALLYALAGRLLASAGSVWAAAEQDVDHFTLAWELRHELPALDPESRMIAGHLLVEGALSTGRMSQAQELLELLGDLGAARRAQDEALHPYPPFMLLQRARVLFFQGRMSEALPIIEETVRRCAEIGDQLWELLCRDYLALVAAHQGEPALARELTPLLAAAFPDPHGYLEGATHTLHAYALSVAGDFEQAITSAVLGGGGPELPNLQAGDRALTYEVLVTATLALGDLAAAQEWGNRSLPLAAHPAGAPIVAQLLARIDLARGEALPSAEAAAVAAARARLTGRYLDAARSDMLRARALASAGLNDTAVREFTGVAHEAQRLGLYAFRRTAATALRQLGRRLGPVPGSGWGSLTERERQIAVLAAEGFSNRVIGTSLFLSERTVQSHLSRVLTALGASSRTGIVRQVAQFRLTEPDYELPPLTPRQRQVVDLVGDGASNREIAEHLGISVKTVEKHIGEVFQRWGVSSRTAIARLATADTAQPTD